MMVSNWIKKYLVVIEQMNYEFDLKNTYNLQINQKKMASSWKNNHHSQGLTHSAVYRVDNSPSPNKYYKRPSSNFAYMQTEAYSYKSNDNYATQSQKNDFMRSTIDTLNYGSKRMNTLNGYKESQYDRQIVKLTDKKQIQNLKGSQRFNTQFYGSVGGESEERGIRNSKRKLENEQPLMNKIIKKLDEKQKLLNQLKKISETQLPTRNKKRSNNINSTLNIDRPKTQLDMNSILKNVISTGIGQSNLLKEKIINSPNQYYRNPQDEKDKNNKTILFHTPKVNKNDLSFNRHNYSAVTSLSGSPAVSDKNDCINLLKKKNVLSYGSSSVLSSKQNNYDRVSFKKSITNVKMLKENVYVKRMSLSDFKVLKTLGQGKFGTVQAAVHISSGSIFALKKINKNVIKSHMMVDQMAIQIRIQSFCNHKNIVRLYNSFDDYDHLYLVLEYMEEGTLFSQLKKNKILTEVQAAQKIKSVAEAVKYLHEHGIAHRDIKPQNIVMSNGVSKLCDFGWAAICNQRRRTHCGTFDYAAPQILQGSEYDMSVDMWCLGVLAYQLMVGKAPFYHISRKETMKKIMNVDTSEIQFPAKLSQNAVSFIKSLLKKQPQDRMNAETVLKHPFLAQVKTQ